MLARTFGSSDNDWLPVGSVACPRSRKPEEVIYETEAALKQGLFRLYPKMKDEADNLEYGFRLKKFPDDPVR